MATARAGERLFLFTCARPGRSRGSVGKIEDALIHKWVQGLAAASNLIVVSLLGQKHTGKDEFSFYSFHDEGRSFQDWFVKNCAEREIQIVSHPTIDSRPVPTATLARAASDIVKLVSEGQTVVLMDSGGVQRVEQVCRYMKAVPAPA